MNAATAPWASKILLVAPGASRKSLVDVPLGLLKLSSALGAAGVEAKLVRAGDFPSDTAFLEFVSALNPAFVGLYTYSESFPEICRLCSGLRRRGFLCILGGPHATLTPHAALKSSGASAVVAGFAEETLVRMCFERNWKLIGKNCILPSGGRRRVCFSRKLGGPIHYGIIKEFIIGPCAIVGASAGCPYKCSFCVVPSVSGSVWRAYPPEQVVNLMENLLKQKRIRRFAFLDDIFGFRKEWLRSFCKEIISRGLGGRIEWFCKERVDSVGLAELRLMKAAGCKLIAFGVESGSQELLDRLNKRTSVRGIESTFARAKKAGIRTQAYFIVGCPGETESDLQKTYELVFRITPDVVQISNFVQYPEEGRSEAKRVFLGKSITLNKGGGARLWSFKRRLLVNYYLNPMTLAGKIFAPGKLLHALVIGFRALTNREVYPEK
ncbi:MAG: radical SAM protein [archaeon]